MSNIWITSDTHFCHNKDFIYKSRGYSDIEEMNKDLIDKWNSIVNEDDEIYHLGDIMLGKLEDGMICLRELKGCIHIIRGNHDSDGRIAAYMNSWNIIDVVYADVIKFHKRHIYLSHYPTLCANYDDYKRFATINCCGHLHTTDKFADMDKGLIYHCEVDAHNGYPILLDQILNDIHKYYGK